MAGRVVLAALLLACAAAAHAAQVTVLADASKSSPLPHYW
jgi:hypothetical protein